LADSEFREYENGIADVLGSVVGESGIVRRNVGLPSRSGGRRRQIDVLVEGDIFGLTDVSMIVDCKRWKTPIDKPDVERFLGLLDDVGADVGMLVSAAGATEGAISRAKAARGVRIKPMSIDELMRWRPTGTVQKVFQIPSADLQRATKALREAGFRVSVRGVQGDKARIEVFRHHGTPSPSDEVQHEQHQLMDTTLDKLKINYRIIEQGVVADGGTPNHRWIDVHVRGNTFIYKLLAATEAELQLRLAALSAQCGLPIEVWAIERPEGWPFPSCFPF
jgi:Restriction endonuclease